MALDAMNDVSDDTLMVLYANGDQDAARMQTYRHAPRVLSLSKRLLCDATEAEDVAQEAMLRLWRVAPDWRIGEAKVSTWLYRVASNLCTDRLRKKRVVALEDAPQSIDDAPSVIETMTSVGRADALQMAMNQLPERQKLAVTLRHIDELTNPEIAEIMDISVDAVESLTARGKRTLAKILLDQKETLGLE